MIQIILQIADKNKVLTKRESFGNHLSELSIDIMPVKILSGEYILPTELLNDERYTDFHSILSILPQRNITNSDLTIDTIP